MAVTQIPQDMRDREMVPLAAPARGCDRMDRKPAAPARGHPAPARDDAGIRAAGQVYGLTHGLQVPSLMLIAACLVAASFPIAREARRRAHAGRPRAGSRHGCPAPLVTEPR
ncbi:hypothetical protein GCM10011574_58940 [Microbispora bryophytorum]|uniref:Uncharacterized protein n=1 Tax=Microbispora bryophytorum TaxID=1460882 RepID=A0A8H9LJ79_9ACTN|nr:hypothetical protein GCM10011574_58940 [Microbispora bryophytorum]